MNMGDLVTLNTTMTYVNATGNHTGNLSSPGTNDYNKSSIDGCTLNKTFYILIGFSVLSVTTITLLAIICERKKRTLIHTIRDLQGEGRSVRDPASDRLVRIRPTLELVPVTLGQQSQDTSSASLLHRQTAKPASGSLWRVQMAPSFNKSGLGLEQLIKAGREGVYHKARMMHGTCKGHIVVTCKMTKEGVSHKRVTKEVNIMRKLDTHKNVLQLLDWNITEAPYVLILESVVNGTLRSFLQVNQDRLSMDKDLQSLFTVAAYHIAHAMCYLHRKMVVHCDLALRNIMVNLFPQEVKVAEFGLAQNQTHLKSRRRSHKGDRLGRVPVRWYPPEYFRNSFYSFKGDVWSFGILLWEMQTFGTLPYPNMATPDMVGSHVCSGHRNSIPETCRPEMRQVISDCWMEPYSQRSSFSDIVRVLENTLEDDKDYVQVDNIC